MNKSQIRVFVFVGVIAFTAAASGVAEAAEEGGGFGAFLRKLFKYPVKTSENVANTAGHAVANTGGVAEAAARNTGAVATGHLEKTGDVVAEPTGKTANMAGQLVSETVGAPVKAAEDVQKEP